MIKKKKILFLYMNSLCYALKPPWHLMLVSVLWVRFCRGGRTATSHCFCSPVSPWIPVRQNPLSLCCGVPWAESGQSHRDLELWFATSVLSWARWSQWEHCHWLQMRLVWAWGKKHGLLRVFCQSKGELNWTPLQTAFCYWCYFNEC